MLCKVALHLYIQNVWRKKPLVCGYSMFVFFRFEWQSEAKQCSVCELFIKSFNEQYSMEECFNSAFFMNYSV